MEYPLISEYRDAILSAEDNFNELSSLRPVLDSAGNPVMSSGNFAVVFKMRDERDGKLYAIKCFTKEQDRRNESYRKIADELESASSSYIIPLRYLEDELFVDSDQCDCEEFPVVLMDWVEGETLSAYIESHIDNKYDLDMLSYRFNRMAAWLLSQPFAHGDLKPDNILVRADGSLVLIDYDGMFVPAMKGEKAREIGSPDYRHPLRTNMDFNENNDDFTIVVIALSLKSIALKPQLKFVNRTFDALLLSEKDFLSISTSEMLKIIYNFTIDQEISLLLGAFFIALANKDLRLFSYRNFLIERLGKNKVPKKELNIEINTVDKVVETAVTPEEIAEGIRDKYGVIYSVDGKRLLKCPYSIKLAYYEVKQGTVVICDEAFWSCSGLKTINLPSSLISIGKQAFMGCRRLMNIHIPNTVMAIGEGAFDMCSSMRSIILPKSLTTIEMEVFNECESLQNVVFPESLTTIENRAFRHCSSLSSINPPEALSRICKHAFLSCENLQNINIPNSVIEIEDGAFDGCSALRSVTISPLALVCTEKVFPAECILIYGECDGDLFEKEGI